MTEQERAPLQAVVDSMDDWLNNEEGLMIEDVVEWRDQLRGALLPPEGRPDLITYMTTSDGPTRDAAWLRMYAEKILNGTAFTFDIPNTIATTISDIATRIEQR